MFCNSSGLSRLVVVGLNWEHCACTHLLYVFIDRSSRLSPALGASKGQRAPVCVVCEQAALVFSSLNLFLWCVGEAKL